jgi:hypothetical protein
VRYGYSTEGGTEVQDNATSGNAIADSIIDALDAATTKLANAIRAVQEDQAKMREEFHALSQRVEWLERINGTGGPRRV